MKIKQLGIKNFRNLEAITYTPGASLNIFLGDNAQGKTSLLEAIFLLGNGASFRDGADKDIVRYNSTGYKVYGEYAIEERTLSSSVIYDAEKNKKSLQLNRKAVNYKHPDLLRFVVFIPDDLFLIKGAPGKRRRFLDFILRQVSGTYASQLENYERILKKRSDWLKLGGKDPEVSAVLDDVFLDNAVNIILSRIRLVSVLDEYWQKIYTKLSEGSALAVRLRYALSFPLAAEAIDYSTIRAAMEKQMVEMLPLEQRRKKCLVGPHLDDLNFYLDHRLAKFYASQGQQRSMVIALKLAEVYAHQLLKQRYPIFLLDEVLSELDEQRKKNLIEYLTNLPCQSFLTAVNLDHIEVNPEHCQISEVRKGNVVVF